MSYTTAEARQGLLDEFARAIDELGVAIAYVGDAYELLDERTADRLEEDVFAPLQTAYGRAKRTHAGFAERHDLPTRTFAPTVAGAPSHGASGFILAAIEAAEEADILIGELQDSMAPVEVGDAELRAGLAEVRGLAATIPVKAHELLRVLGR